MRMCPRRIAKSTLSRFTSNIAGNVAFISLEFMQDFAGFKCLAKIFNRSIFTGKNAAILTPGECRALIFPGMSVRQKSPIVQYLSNVSSHTPARSGEIR